MRDGARWVAPSIYAGGRNERGALAQLRRRNALLKIINSYYWRRVIVCECVCKVAPFLREKKCEMRSIIRDAPRAQRLAFSLTDSLSFAFADARTFSQAFIESQG